MSVSVSAPAPQTNIVQTNIVEVQVKALLTAVKAVGNAINSSAILPILETIHLQATEGKLVVTASDLETFAYSELSVEDTQAEFSVCVDFKIIKKTLEGLVGELDSIKLGVDPNCEVAFSMQQTKTINFRGKPFERTYKYELHGLAGEDYPKMPEFEGEKTVKISNGQIKLLQGEKDTPLYLSLSGTAKMVEISTQIGVELGESDQAEDPTLYRMEYPAKRQLMRWGGGDLWFNPKNPEHLLLEKASVKVLFKSSNGEQLSDLFSNMNPPKNDWSCLVNIEPKLWLDTIARTALAGRKKKGTDIVLDLDGKESMTVTAIKMGYLNHVTETYTKVVKEFKKDGDVFVKDEDGNYIEIEKEIKAKRCILTQVGKLVEYLSPTQKGAPTKIMLNAIGLRKALLKHKDAKDVNMLIAEGKRVVTIQSELGKNYLSLQDMPTNT